MKTLFLMMSALMITLPAQAETAEVVKAGELKLTPPKTWKVEQPSSSMRKAQFKVPGEAGDAECVVFFFGTGQGGGAEANIRRWISQFADDGKRASEQSKGDSREGKYQLLSVTGTYNQSVGGPFSGKKTAKPGSRMLAAIVAHASGNYYVKMTGPEATVTANKDGLLASIGAK